MHDRSSLSRSSVHLLSLLMTAVLVAAGCDERPSPTELESPAELSFLRTSTEIAPGTRSVIFDGSTESGSVFDIDLSDGESQVGPATVNIPRLLLLHPAFNPDLQLLPAEPPTSPELDNDCEALGNVGAVEAFLIDAEQFADGTASSIEACAAEVGALVEEVLGLIESAEEDEEDDVAQNQRCMSLAPRSDFSPFMRSGAGFCELCTNALANVSRRLDPLSRYAAGCNQIREDLVMLRERVLGELDSGELSREMACLAESGQLEEFAKLAERSEENARLAADEVASTIESGVCCEGSLEKNCEECELEPIGGEEEEKKKKTLTEAVFKVPAGPAIGHIVGALNTAASHTDDDDEATALKELGFRLATTPRNLTRRIVFPAEVPATVDLLAVRPSFAVDGRPPVFILSAVPDELLPHPTLLDEVRWFEETDAWREMFTKGSVEFPQ